MLLMGISLAGFFGAPQAFAVQIVASQDTFVTELAPDAIPTGAGLTQIGIRSSSSSSQNVIGLLQFDISSLTDDVATASLNLTANRDHAETYVVHFLGALEADAGAWTEATATWNNAAILFPDGVNLATEIGAGNTLLDQWDLVPNGDTDDTNALVTALGSGSFSSDLDETMSLSSAALVSFLNSARANGDTTVTFALAAEPHSHNIVFNFYSKEGTATDAFKPHLDVTLVPEPAALSLASCAVAILGLMGWRRRWTVNL